MAFERLQLAALRWEDRHEQPDATRSRLQWRRVRAVLLLVGFAVLTGLRFRGSSLTTVHSRIAWAAIMAGGISVLAWRVFYLNRALAALDSQDHA